MGLESGSQQNSERAGEEQGLRSRIDNLQRGVDESNRVLESVEQKLAQARAGGKGEGEIRALEESAGHKRRERDEDKAKLDNLREELRRTSQ